MCYILIVLSVQVIVHIHSSLCGIRLLLINAMSVVKLLNYFYDSQYFILVFCLDDRLNAPGGSMFPICCMHAGFDIMLQLREWFMWLQWSFPVFSQAVTLFSIYVKPLAWIQTCFAGQPYPVVSNAYELPCSRTLYTCRDGYRTQSPSISNPKLYRWTTDATV